MLYGCKPSCLVLIPVALIGCFASVSALRTSPGVATPRIGIAMLSAGVLGPLLGDLCSQAVDDGITPVTGVSAVLRSATPRLIPAALFDAGLANGCKRHNNRHGVGLLAGQERIGIGLGLAPSINGDPIRDPVAFSTLPHRRPARYTWSSK